MFDKEQLKRTAEQAIRDSEETSHLEETGLELLHYDFEILELGETSIVTGRDGDYYKFGFTYEVTLLDEAGLKSEEDNIRRFRRSVRMNQEGKIVAISGRVEL